MLFWAINQDWCITYTFLSNVVFEFVREQGSGVKMTACDSETCRWQMEHGTDLPSRHPVEFLAAAYGLYDLGKRQLTKE